MPTGSESNICSLKDGQKMIHFQKGGNTDTTSPIISKKEMSGKAKNRKFRFNKKGKFTDEEKAEIKRTSSNIFDWFRSGTMNISKPTIKDLDTAREAEKEEIMMKIRMKREKDRERAARMEVRRNKWTINNICSSIMKELMDGMEPFKMEGWIEELETHLLTLP